MSQLSQRRTAARLSVPNGHRRPLMRFSDWNVNIPHRIIVDGNHAPLSRDDDQIRGGATRAQN
jgi:hypothetical protein